MLPILILSFLCLKVPQFGSWTDFKIEIVVLVDNERSFVDGMLGTSVFFVAHFHPVVAVSTTTTPIATTAIEFRVPGVFFGASLGIDFVPHGAVSVPDGIDELVLRTVKRTAHVDISISHLVGMSAPCREGSLVIFDGALCEDGQGRCRQQRDNSKFLH